MDKPTSDQKPDATPRPGRVRVGGTKLTPQQEAFAQAVAEGKSQSAAYRLAYPKSKDFQATTVHESASRLAADVNVSARIKELRAAIAEASILKSVDILHEIRRIAMSDPRGIMHPDGRVKLPHELDDSTAAGIASFKVKESGEIEYKFWDKNSALERAAKILGLFEKDNAQKTDPFTELLHSIARSNASGFQPVERDPDHED